MKLTAVSVREHKLPEFTVTGGPLAAPQHMGWHITNERGFTVAVSNYSNFCEHLNSLEQRIQQMEQSENSEFAGGGGI